LIIFELTASIFSSRRLPPFALRRYISFRRHLFSYALFDDYAAFFATMLPMMLRLRYFRRHYFRCLAFELFFAFFHISLLRHHAHHFLFIALMLRSDTSPACHTFSSVIIFTACLLLFLPARGAESPPFSRHANMLR